MHVRAQTGPASGPAIRAVFPGISAHWPSDHALLPHLHLQMPLLPPGAHAYTIENTQLHLNPKPSSPNAAAASRLTCLTHTQQPGEGLSDVARSFNTDWLQLYSANAHLTNPHKVIHPLMRCMIVRPCNVRVTSELMFAPIKKGANIRCGARVHANQDTPQAREAERALVTALQCSIKLKPNPQRLRPNPSRIRVSHDIHSRILPGAGAATHQPGGSVPRTSGRHAGMCCCI